MKSFSQLLILQVGVKNKQSANSTPIYLKFARGRKIYMAETLSFRCLKNRSARTASIASNRATCTPHPSNSHSSPTRANPTREPTHIAPPSPRQTVVMHKQGRPAKYLQQACVMSWASVLCWRKNTRPTYEKTWSLCSETSANRRRRPGVASLKHSVLGGRTAREYLRVLAS